MNSDTLKPIIGALNDEITLWEQEIHNLEMRKRDLDASYHEFSKKEALLAVREKTIDVTVQKVLEQKTYNERAATEIEKKVQTYKKAVEELDQKESDYIKREKKLEEREKHVSEREDKVAAIEERLADIIKREQIMEKQEVMDKERRIILDLREKQLKDKEARLQRYADSAE